MWKDKDGKIRKDIKRLGWKDKVGQGRIRKDGKGRGRKD